MSYYENALIKAAAISKATDFLTDEEAETVTILFPFWDADCYYNKVTYKGEHYISLINANVYSPEAYPAGWEKQ